MKNLAAITTPYRQLDVETQTRLYQAALCGYELEVFTDPDWKPVYSIHFDFDKIYRLKSCKPTFLELDWNQLSSTYFKACTIEGAIYVCDRSCNWHLLDVKTNPSIVISKSTWCEELNAPPIYRPGCKDE